MDNNILKIQNKIALIIHVIVIVSYGIKSFAKAFFGFFLLNSIPLMIDAVHSAIDIVEHAIISIAGRYARKKPDEKFPIGRMPLLDITGMLISLIVLFVSLTCFRNALLGSIENDFNPSRDNIAFVAIVFLMCSVISWIVFFYEKKLAVEHALKEYVEDANELRCDASLELAAGLAALIAWGTSFIWPDTIESIYFWSSRIILLGIGFYLLYHGLSSFRENAKNLMNPGIDKLTLLALAEHINLNLPEGSRLISTEEFPLKTFSRADDLFVFGTFNVERGLIAESSKILEKAEIITKKYLSSTKKNVIISYKISPTSTDSKEIERNAALLLNKFWHLTPESILAKPFYLLQNGDISGSDEAIKDIDITELTKEENLLFTWIKAQKAIYLDGPAHPDSYKIERELQDTSIASAGGVLFLTWRLLRIILSGDIYKPEYQKDVAILMDKLNKIIHQGDGYDLIVRAECAFVLGIYSERHRDYSIDKSTEYFKISERCYHESGIISEIDRLYNSWGHQKTLLFELEEATMLLEKSLDIKRQKSNGNPTVGMAFTMGCLADVYSRSTLFDKAEKFYKQDLQLIDQTKSHHFEPGVTIKLAESLIRRGAFECDDKYIDSGNDLCRKLLQRENLSKETTFFASKALMKGLLWQYEATNNGINDDNYMSECLDLVERMSPLTDYSKAFAFRMQGRMMGHRGCFNDAYKSFTKSDGLFVSMSRGLKFRNLAMQSIVCKFDIGKFKIMEDSRKLNEIEIAINDLNEFIKPIENLIGPVEDALKENIESLRKSIFSIKKKRNTDPGYVAKKIISPINKLIILLEG